MNCIALSLRFSVSVSLVNYPPTQRFVHYATASPYLPDPGLMEPKDKIKIEFSAAEMTQESLPVAHTCVNTLKFPHFAYDNNSETLKEKLRFALRACSKLGAFGMR